MKNTHTVQFTQFGITEVEDFPSITSAQMRFEEVCSDGDTDLAWIFDGVGQNAAVIDQFVRSQR